MADIKELGESLLTRQQTRNDRQYKESKREAYKIAIAEAGIGLVNTHLRNKATEFLTSEPVLAQKAKYRAAVTQAERISAMQQQIEEAGKSPEEWFLENRYMPVMEEQYKAQYGTQFVPESYLPLLREKAMELSAQEAEGFKEAVRVAQSIPDMETAMAQVNSIVVPPTNAGQGLLRKVKGLFQGKSEEDFRQESLARLESEGAFVNESVRDAFNKVNRLQGYDQAVNFVKSLNTSGFEPNDKVEAKVDIVPDPAGTGWGIFTITTTTDSRGNTIDQKVTQERIDGVLKPEDDQKVFRAVVEKTDYPKMAKDILSPAGQSLFVGKLNERGLNYVDIKTPEEYTRISRVFQDVVSNANNLRDDIRASSIGESIGAAFTAVGPLLSDMVSTMREEGYVESEIMQELLDKVSSAVDSIPQLRPEAVDTPTTIYPTQQNGNEPTSWFDL
jgi:hypothetical protein